MKTVESMKKIASFEIDHTRLNKGVYVSRIDKIGVETVTTFDIRMKRPNIEVLDIKAVHTLEHLIATFVRNDEAFSDRILYFGPMGCLTGMYLIVHGEMSSLEILPLITRAFHFVEAYEGAIPGVSAVECGTYKLHSLQGAKEEATQFLKILENADASNLEYPV